MTDALEPYGEPVTTAEELDSLDSDDIVEGYRDGRANEPRPTGNRSKGYWHGWRNGQVDGHHAKSDPAMRLLIADCRRKGRIGFGSKG